MNFGGIKVFEFCDNAVQTVESIWNTAMAFVGGLSSKPRLPVFGSHVPGYMEKASVEFLGTTMGYHLEPRKIKKVEIDPDLIHDGDFFPILRLDGLDPLIMFGTGAHAGHCVMALRFDGELYLVESQAAWYWPKINIQRTKWADWIQYAENASFLVSWMPLRKEYRAKFDNKKAVEFFWKTEGLPYGYHNFLFGWIDTPRNNIPGLVPNEGIPIVFSLVEHVMPQTISIFFSEALNFRLGTKDLNIA